MLYDITLSDGTVVPSDPSKNPIWAGIGPGSIPYISNQSPGAGGTAGLSWGRTAYKGPADYATKYKYIFGVPFVFPTGYPGSTPSAPHTNCGPGTNDPNCTGGTVSQIPTPVVPMVRLGPLCPTGQVLINGQCTATGVESPPLTSPVTPTVSQGRTRRQRPTRSRQPHRGDQAPGEDSGDICPIRGYVSRPIPGADEYQNFRCTPGQPVVIDRGIAAAGAAGAYARQGGGPSLWTGQQGGWGRGTGFYNPRPRFVHGLGDDDPTQQPFIGMGYAGLGLLAVLALFILAPKKSRY